MSVNELDKKKNYNIISITCNVIHPRSSWS